jgi:hypothetical protein
MSGTLTILHQRTWAGAVRFANAHLSGHKTAAKMGHPESWLNGVEL